uniref:Hydrolase, TatD family n=1 Tax=Caenorhabditis tropicalis TaxID=1561998 RepID=A0A1I7TG66_9PELO
MIDVHCHLVDNKFKEDLDSVIRQALSAGVQKMINVPEFSSQFEKSIEISKQWNGTIYTGIGIHPIQVIENKCSMKHLAQLEQFFVEHERDIICVGECSLDHTTTQFKLTDADFEEQERVFKSQIDLAKHFDKPLNVHSRSAAYRTIECLQECQVGTDRVVLHAFDGSLEDLQLGLQCGYLFSVPPSFAKSEKIFEILESIPLSQILLETDSPALGPEKGVKNVPSNLTISAELISRIKGIPVDDVIFATSANANRVFRF